MLKINFVLTSVALLCLSACGSQPARQDAAAQLPESFIGLVSYADADEVRRWQADQVEYVILDVRTATEFAEDGHAPGAVLESYYRSEQRRPENVSFLNNVAARYDADQKLLLICARGVRATQAAWELGNKKGFKDVHVFAGGYEGYDKPGYGNGRGWKSDGLPTLFPVADADEVEAID